tara:strand:- start:472 stop:2049 length:1578 start_codon:yes stop_codon:yes gene_type:complete
MTTFKRMTRGIKLLVEHIFDPIAAALADLTTSGIPSAQYEKEEGTFRVNINFPLANDFSSGASFNKTSTLTVPFVLPPLQEEFGANINLITDYELIEVSVGQDTRGESASIRPATEGPGLVGLPVMGQAFSFDLSIKSHAMDPSAHNDYNNEVFSLSVPEIALLNPYSRLNPHVQSGIAIPFTHENSYLLQVTPHGIDTVVSLFISLKFKTKLRTREVAGEGYNQTPFSPRNFVTQAHVTPNADTPIEADTNDGVNTGFKLIDSIIQRKFYGGYNKWGMTYPKEGLSVDAGYEVISVPMFASWPHVSGGPRVTRGIGGDLPFETMPWVDIAGNKYTTIDRAIIPINYPLSIHHVIVAVNYTAPDNSATYRPTHAVAPNLKHEVGVGIMSGHRSDNITLQQVAFVDWLPSTISSKLIDRGDYRHTSSTGAAYGYSWDLISCPVEGSGGSGYITQGKPLFVASGNSDTGPRTNIDTAPSKTLNGEQVLDVRWKISNGAVSPTTWGSTQTIVGYGGHWVYLICKKTVI